MNEGLNVCGTAKPQRQASELEIVANELLSKVEYLQKIAGRIEQCNSRLNSPTPKNVAEVQTDHSPEGVMDQLRLAINKFADTQTWMDNELEILERNI